LLLSSIVGDFVDIHEHNNNPWSFFNIILHLRQAGCC
jgi:hypothetical protein